MEIIQLSGYTEFEKLNIAVKYLVPAPAEEARPQGLRHRDHRERDPHHDPPLHAREPACVTSSARSAACAARSRARWSKIGEGQAREDARRRQEHPQVPGRAQVPTSSKAGEKDEIGLTNGLAYTSYGGAILECEVTVVPGKGKLVITGLLEKGMQESAQAAMSYIRSRQKLLGLEQDFYQKIDIHIHFPEFVPKDGPSAGITMATSIASALMKIPVRQNVAMTGEITLRGRVMPIGGLKEKLLAAHRARHRHRAHPQGKPQRPARDPAPRAQDHTRRAGRAHGRGAARGPGLSDPDEFFGHRERPLEYVGGLLNDPNQPDSASEEEGSLVPTPTVEPPGARQ